MVVAIAGILLWQGKTPAMAPAEDAVETGQAIIGESAQDQIVTTDVEYHWIPGSTRRRGAFPGPSSHP